MWQAAVAAGSGRQAAAVTDADGGQAWPGLAVERGRRGDVTWRAGLQCGSD